MDANSQSALNAQNNPGVHREFEGPLVIPEWAQTLMSQVTSLSQRLDEQQKAHTELAYTPATSETAQGAPAPLTDNAGPRTKKKKLLPDPPEFDGTKQSEFKPWLSQIVAKLLVNLNEESETVQF